VRRGRRGTGSRGLSAKVRRQMPGCGREGDPAAAHAHRDNDSLSNEQSGCAHQWSPWSGSRTEMGSPEGRHSLSLTRELAVGFGRGRER
jgi:hypothetical protein